MYCHYITLLLLRSCADALFFASFFASLLLFLLRFCLFMQSHHEAKNVSFCPSPGINTVFAKSPFFASLCGVLIHFSSFFPSIYLALIAIFSLFLFLLFRFLLRFLLRALHFCFLFRFSACMKQHSWRPSECPF